ncbi:MAG: lysophospholipid acyltransferase family protein [Pseudomonadota bacterium]
MRPLLRLLAGLPLPLTHALGAGLGRLALLLRPRLAQDMAANLAQAGLDSAALRRRAAAELGKGVLELLPIWLRPLDKSLKLVREVRGWQHVEAAVARGRGVVLLCPHLGSQELAGLYFAPRFSVTALYRRPRQDWFHALMLAGRQRGRLTTVEPGKRGVRAMLQALKRNEFVFILPDQAASRGDGAWLPFFGRPAYMPLLPYRLLESTGATPLLVYAERLAFGRGFRLHIEPLTDLPRAPVEAAGAVNRRIEAAIRRHPAQYLWNYRIYRYRPDLMPPPPNATEAA